MTARDSILVGREPVADGTVAFHFRRPADFAFQAGQAIDLTLPQPATDPGGAKHALSIVSAPFEDMLTIATRMRASAYKRALGALPDGAPVGVEGPFGSLTLHGDRARPALLVAGGIGITPFMSMLRQAAHDRLEQEFVVVHSSRTAADTPFRSELEDLGRRLRSFRLLATLTNGGASRAGRTGRIDGALLAGALAGLKAPVCYVTGSPPFVSAMRHALEALGVGDDDLRSEEFFGY